MKKLISPYLLKFAFAAFILTVSFRFCLSYSLKNEWFILVCAFALLYFVCMFLTGWYYGRKDGNFLPFANVGFLFNLTTFLIFHIVTWLWFVLDFNAVREKIINVYWGAVIWGIILIPHFFLFLWAQKKSIKGLEKGELFE